eukprot:TRINITY_DN12169_c0_g1_i1.p1 TRINITY_DN12169_c0_g1~~TRINITY_DN12169_c0_g1_i1.p1  ORF type:complete len:520 (+),score=64.48 TRINITY_DN12169_c0_g1_i1:52-1611(+)
MILLLGCLLSCLLATCALAADPNHVSSVRHLFRSGWSLHQLPAGTLPPIYEDALEVTAKPIPRILAAALPPPLNALLYQQPFTMPLPPPEAHQFRAYANMSNISYKYELMDEDLRPGGPALPESPHAPHEFPLSLDFIVYVPLGNASLDLVMLKGSHTAAPFYVGAGNAMEVSHKSRAAGNGVAVARDLKNLVTDRHLSGRELKDIPIGYDHSCFGKLRMVTVRRGYAAVVHASLAHVVLPTDHKIGPKFRDLGRVAYRQAVEAEAEEEAEAEDPEDIDAPLSSVVVRVAGWLPKPWPTAAAELISPYAAVPSLLMPGPHSESDEPVGTQDHPRESSATEQLQAADPDARASVRMWDVCEELGFVEMVDTDDRMSLPHLWLRHYRQGLGTLVDDVMRNDEGDEEFEEMSQQGPSDPYYVERRRDAWASLGEMLHTGGREGARIGRLVGLRDPLEAVALGRLALAADVPVVVREYPLTHLTMAEKDPDEELEEFQRQEAEDRREQSSCSKGKRGFQSPWV